MVIFHSLHFFAFIFHKRDFHFRDSVAVRNSENLQALDEDECEEEVGGEADTSEDEAVEENSYNTESEQEASGLEELDNSETSDEYFVGKNKRTLWNKLPVVSKFSKTNKKNIVRILPDVKPCIPYITDERYAFDRFFTDDIIENIVYCTNLEIARMRENYDRSRNARDTTKTEILAFIGLLILAGAKKQDHTHFRELWTTDGTGSEIFRACMGSIRFLFLLSAVRFDDKTTRADRKKTDKLAAIRFTIDRFVENCKNNYCLGEQITIDEMLIPFRGNCNFIQYIPNKPAKCGLKMFVVCDSKTFYVNNLEIYCGQQPQGQYKLSNTSADITHRLLQPWKGKNINVTCDNWYTSYPLAINLLKDKITMVGTIKKNKGELPSEFQPYITREPGSYIFGFQKDATLVSYVPKRNRAVILLSTMHSDSAVDPETKKPDILTQYDCYKGGVDSVDKLCSTYTVSRRTRRWSLAIFFQLLNIAGVNSQILYNQIHDERHKYRRIFLKNLSLSLMKQHLEERAMLKNLPVDIKCFLNKYKQQQPQQENEDIGEPSPKMRKRCRFCGRAKNRVTTLRCSSCNEFVCKEHSVTEIKCDTCAHPAMEESDADYE